MRIARHTISELDLVAKAHAEDMARLPKFVESNRITGQFSITTGIALMAAQTGSATEGNEANVARALRIAADTAACLFAGASTAGVTPLLDGHPVAQPKLANESPINVGNWLQALFLNILCRNTDHIDLLCGVPLKVLCGSSTQGPEYLGLFVRALQSFWKDETSDDEGRGLVAMLARRFQSLWRRPKTTADLLIDAMQKTDPERYQFVKTEYVLQIDVPQIYLFSQVASDDPAAAGTLATALENQKKYWSRTKDRRLEPIGYLAVNLLGLAAMAYDRNIPFDIDSEYLPMYLVDGSFLNP